MRETDGAPHGKVFYIFIVALGLLGVACSVALSQNSDSSLLWRSLFAIPTVFFLCGVAQAVERLGWPERAQARSKGLSGGTQLGFVLARWTTMVVSLGGCGVVSLVSLFGDADTQDICENLRILFFFLLFVCFCLADVAGEETFPQSMWSKAWQTSPDDHRGLTKTRRRFF